MVANFSSKRDSVWIGWVTVSVSTGSGFWESVLTLTEAKAVRFKVSRDHEEDRLSRPLKHAEQKVHTDNCVVSE